MSKIPNLLVSQLQVADKKVFGGGAQAVRDIVELGKLLVQLRGSAKRKWRQHARQLGYADRLADRLINIGSSWFAQGSQLVTSGVLTKMPADVTRLDWLCRLSKQELQACAGSLDLRRCTQYQLVAGVKRHLQPQPAATPARVQAAPASDGTDAAATPNQAATASQPAA